MTSSTTGGVAIKDAIGYLRVSTKEQGRSGLGLPAQRFDIEQFGKREGFLVKSWHQDIQTGAGKDAILLRPGLAAALKEARSLLAPVPPRRRPPRNANVKSIVNHIVRENVMNVFTRCSPLLAIFGLHQARSAVFARRISAHIFGERYEC